MLAFRYPKGEIVLSGEAGQKKVNWSMTSERFSHEHNLLMSEEVAKQIEFRVCKEEVDAELSCS
jgi:hypothetical protein